jgi:type III pantothenate kinase
MILIDVGNTRAHVWKDGVIEHMKIDEVIARYRAHRVHYINVNLDHHDALSALANWENLSERIEIQGAYEGMGIDRKALCLSHEEGIFVDAGSAITVDRVEDGRYAGGFLLPGLQAYRRAFAGISPVLDHPITPIDPAIDAGNLPRDTAHGISYGVIGSIVAAVEKIRGSFPVYITGGDGAMLAKQIDGSLYDDALVFLGMRKAVRSI